MRHLIPITSIAAAVALTIPSPSVAQDAEEDLITVTGLRPEAISDVTASVTVIESEQLRIRSAPYLADQLRSVPGLAVSRSGSVGGLTQIRMRGAEANHTLVLVDGIEISDPTTGETDFGLWGGLDVARIEIARGEQSALYGSDAIGGVISVETGGSGLRGEAETGSRQTSRGFVAYGQEGDRSAFGASLSGYSTEGVDTSATTGEEDGSGSVSGLLRARRVLGGDWTLSGIAFVNRSTAETDTDTDFDGPLNDTIRETESDQFVAGASLQGPALGLDHRFRASFTEVERENTADGMYTDRTTGERVKLAWSPSKSWETGEVRHRLTGLIDLETEDYRREDTDTVFGDPNQSQSFDTVGIAAEYALSVGRTSFNGSVRHDDNDGRFENAVTWRLGAAYDTGTFGRFRISGGEGIKNPTFTELYGFFPATFVGNPDLEPERSQSVEIGWDKRFEQGSISIAAFRAELEDEIYTAFDASFNSTALNREETSERAGVELSGDWSPVPQVTLFGSASSISSDSDTGEKEIRVPEWTASLGGLWESSAVPGFTLGAAADFVGEQDDFDFGAVPSRRVTLDSYALVSATLAYPITERVSVTLRGEDLLDEAPTDVFGYTQPGAGVFVGVRIN